ncbi:MAG: DUF3617 domain-containing protein [Erythrobacter sp.]
MKSIIIASVGAVLLAGCSGGGNADADGNGEVSIKEAANKAEAEGLKPEAGQYKAVITMSGMDIPGMPPEMKGHGAGLTTTTEYCLTQEDVDKGFEEMMKRGQNGECSYERFSLKDGKMDAVMVCKTAEGDARMTMNGTVTPTSSDFTASMAMQVPEMGEGKMTFTARHERVGDCPAK